MNEDVFPIEHGGFSNVTLVFRGLYTFPKCHISAKEIAGHILIEGLLRYKDGLHNPNSS